MRYQYAKGGVLWLRLLCLRYVLGGVFVDSRSCRCNIGMDGLCCLAGYCVLIPGFESWAHEQYFKKIITNLLDALGIAPAFPAFPPGPAPRASRVLWVSLAVNPQHGFSSTPTPPIKKANHEG